MRVHIKPHRVGFSLRRKNRRVRSEKDNTRSLLLCIIKVSSTTGRYTIILYCIITHRIFSSMAAAETVIINNNNNNVRRRITDFMIYRRKVNRKSIKYYYKL